MMALEHGYLVLRSVQTGYLESYAGCLGVESMLLKPEVRRLHLTRNLAIIARVGDERDVA